MKLFTFFLSLLLVASVHGAPATPVRSAPEGGDGLAQDGAAQPLSPGAAERLMALGHALALVRYFHPADSVATANWDAIAHEGVAVAEAAPDTEALQKGLEQLFAPIAPGLRWNARDIKDALPPPQALYQVAQRHRGYGQDEAVYRTWREYLPATGTLPHYRAALGAGLVLDMPLAAYADAARHSLPSLATNTADLKTSTARQYRGSDRTTRLADTLQAWGALYYFFPYSDIVPLDWNALLRTSLAAAATNRDEIAFTHTLARMVSALRDGHARVTGPRDADYFSPALLIRFIDGHAIAGPSLLPVPAGSELTAIDGQPLSVALRRIAEEFTAPSASMQSKLNATELLAGLRGTSVALHFTGPDGRHGVANLVRDTRLSSIPPPPATAAIAELRPGTWYVDLARADDDVIAAAMAQLSEADAIIFDARYRVEPSMSLLGHLSDVSVGGPRNDIALIESPERTSWKWETLRMKIVPAKPRLRGRMYFLIGGGTLSSSETFMEMVRSHKLGTMVGAPTAGTSGNITSIALAGGYKIYWTGLRFLHDDGARFHGIGIAPDVPVVETPAGVAAGKDEALEVALALAVRSTQQVAK